MLFCSLPLNLGVPFGGFDEIGGGVAVLLWLYLFHVIVLAGYSATLVLSRWRATRALPDVSSIMRLTSGTALPEPANP